MMFSSVLLNGVAALKVTGDLVLAASHPEQLRDGCRILLNCYRKHGELLWRTPIVFRDSDALSENVTSASADLRVIEWTGQGAVCLIDADAARLLGLSTGEVTATLPLTHTFIDSLDMLDVRETPDMSKLVIVTSGSVGCFTGLRSTWRHDGEDLFVHRVESMDDQGVTLDVFVPAGQPGETQRRFVSLPAAAPAAAR